jgi:predicted nucleotidyltransferase
VDILEGAFAAEPAVVFALLYGSRARGGARLDSDWDLAVLLSDTCSATERLQIRLDLLAALEPLGQVDLVVLNDAPPLLGHRALCGELVFVRDRSTYARYFVRTLAAAGDERHFRELHRRARQRRLEEERFGRP